MQLSIHNQPHMTNMAAENFVKPKKYIAGISDLAALAPQLIRKGILIYRRYIGAGCTQIFKGVHH